MGRAGPAPAFPARTLGCGDAGAAPAGAEWKAAFPFGNHGTSTPPAETSEPRACRVSAGGGRGPGLRPPLFPSAHRPPPPWGAVGRKGEKVPPPERPWVWPGDRTRRGGPLRSIDRKCLRPCAGDGARPPQGACASETFPWFSDPSAGCLYWACAVRRPRRLQVTQGGVVCRESRSLAWNRSGRLVGTTIPRVQSAAGPPASLRRALGVQASLPGLGGSRSALEKALLGGRDPAVRRGPRQPVCGGKGGRLWAGWRRQSPQVLEPFSHTRPTGEVGVPSGPGGGGFAPSPAGAQFGLPGAQFMAPTGLVKSEDPFPLTPLSTLT